MTSRQMLVSFAAAALLCVAAYPCGPDFPAAVFVTMDHPSRPYAEFVGGQLGIPQKNYKVRDLVTVYNYVTGHALTLEQQAATVATETFFNQSWDGVERPANSSPMEKWLAARKAFAGVTVDPNLNVARDRATSSYESFANCLDEAFATATKTLDARVAAYGANSAAVAEWVRGQDAVFSNCTDGRPITYYGPGNAPPPPTKPYMPPETAKNAPVWLKQDRAYQMAAARFYATQYDEAIAGFRTIAADEKSPWSLTARYIVARALLRKATVPGSSADDQTKQQATAEAQHQDLAQARRELLTMQREPRMAPMQHAVSALLDYVNIRYEPGPQATVLAQRVRTKDGSSYEQSLIDLTFLSSGSIGATLNVPKETLQQDRSGLLLWMDVFAAGDESRAMEQWKAHDDTVWLLAAISFAKPGDASAAQLIASAQKVPRDNPAWMAITYHRLRLMPHDETTRREVLALLPEIQKTNDVSTINLFLALETTSAPTLDAWLAAAPRYETAELDNSGEVSGDYANPVDGMCGDKTKNGATALFDLDAAFAINNWMPLAMMATAAENSTLPENLRYDLAQATWARSVMLDRPDIARRMSPIMIGCRISWKPVLDAYNHSTNATDRKANGLLAMMRFASLEPSVRYGEERRNGFATYDEYRQNWWCQTVPTLTAASVDFLTRGENDATNQAVGPVEPTKPLFLTAADVAAAQSEVKALRAVPTASEYFTAQALEWQKEHPSDPRTADVLGEAFRVERNSCSSKLASTQVHQVFDVLHAKYPHSAWAMKYTTWE